MKSKPEHEKRERQDWAIVLLILLLGFLCVAVAGQWALRLSPSWKLNTDMESNLDPNSDFSTRKPIDFIEPLEEGILTKPAWEGFFLTPGAVFATGTPLPPPPPLTATIPTTELPTLPVGTNTLIATVTPVPTNTFIWLPPPPATNTKKPKPADTPTNTPVPTGDLVITMNDGGLIAYEAGQTVTYTILVTNNSAIDVIGAALTDAFPAEITGTTWTCAADIGATCTPAGGGLLLSDTISIPAGPGLSVTYTVIANISPTAWVTTLVNTATVPPPAGFPDTNPGNNIVTQSTAPPLIVGPRDDVWASPPSGTSITMMMPAITADPAEIGVYDLVFYERLATPATVDFDWVQVEISSDGSTWYKVFDWGDGSPDMNTTIGIAGLCPLETDNCTIATGGLYNVTGVAIDIDGPLAVPVPAGNYTWVQITCPLGDLDGGCDIDAIQPYYP